MKKKRGNPNWGKPDLHSTARIQANSFEEIVRKLRLLPEQRNVRFDATSTNSRVDKFDRCSR